MLFKHLSCQVAMPNSVAADRLSDVTKPMNIKIFRAAVMADFSVQQKDWCHLQSSDWWEHVFLESFDDEVACKFLNAPPPQDIC